MTTRELFDEARRISTSAGRNKKFAELAPRAAGEGNEDLAVEIIREINTSAGRNDAINAVMSNMSQDGLRELISLASTSALKDELRSRL